MTLYIATITGDPGRLVRFVTGYDDVAYNWLREAEKNVPTSYPAVFEVEAKEFQCDGSKIFEV